MQAARLWPLLLLVAVSLGGCVSGEWHCDVLGGSTKWHQSGLHEAVWAKSWTGNRWLVDESSTAPQVPFPEPDLQAQWNDTPGLARIQLGPYTGHPSVGLSLGTHQISLSAGGDQDQEDELRRKTLDLLELTLAVPARADSIIEELLETRQQVDPDRPAFGFYSTQLEESDLALLERFNASRPTGPGEPGELANTVELRGPDGLRWTLHPNTTAVFETGQRVLDVNAADWAFASFSDHPDLSRVGAKEEVRATMAALGLPSPSLDNFRFEAIEDCRYHHD